MRQSVCTKTAPNIAGLLGGLLLLMFAVSLSAQAAQSHGPRGPRPGYDRTSEITVNATIQKLVTKATPGSPAGLHMLIAGPQGTMDAHLGPYLTKDVREALAAGTPVQIIGATETVRGKTYLLARQLIFGGRLVNVRTANGFLVRPETTRPTRPGAAGASHVSLNGGAQ